MNCLGLRTEVLVLGPMGPDLNLVACEVKCKYEESFMLERSF
jgi:hypothetical protein